MIALFSIEFWMILLFFINFFVLIFLFVFVRKVNRLPLGRAQAPSEVQGLSDKHLASESAARITDMLEPLMKESQKAAIRFDEQIKEKKRLLKGLNDALDSRIISINLLLSRADALHKRMEDKPVQSSQGFPSAGQNHFPLFSHTGLNQQDQILALYRQDLDNDAIARQLSIPKGEVQLVIDLKKKFMAMENDSR